MLKEDKFETTMYQRRPFDVEVVQVTEENMEAVADWCHGKIENGLPQDGAFIRVGVQRPLNDRQTKAYPEDWVLFAGTGFKVYTNNAFHKTFEPKSPDVMDGGTLEE